MEKLILNAPESEMGDGIFYSPMYESVKAYKKEKIDQSNRDSEYNYLEANYHEQSAQSQCPKDDLGRVLLTYHSIRWN